MTVIVYLLVAVAAAALSTRAWVSDRDDEARRAFLALGWCIALAYLGFALSLLPRLADLRIVYMAAGCCIPALALWCVDRLFSRNEPGPSPYVARVAGVTAVGVPATVIAHLIFFRSVPRASPPEVLAGVLCAAGFGVLLYRLWEAHEATSLRFEKARLRYLLAFASLAIVLTFLEQIARGVGAPVDPATLALASRGITLQGPIPPLSVLLTGTTVYFLYYTIAMYRLLDLHELFSRLVTLVLVALVLVFIDTITVTWVGTAGGNPVHSAFQLFLASLLFLAAYDPMRDVLARSSNRLFNQRGQQLSATLASLRGAIPTGISKAALTDTLLTGLQASGRVPVCSVYLWDAQLDAFACIGYRGAPDNPPLTRVAARPFTDGFVAGHPWYLRGSMERRATTDPSRLEIIALMDAMNAQLTLPFVSGGAVLGWLHLHDEPWSDGFSADEIQRLAEVASLASVVLSNIQDFQALEERNRLIAMGQMAAGLAHEIRNPLAGIKGAAQYLQGEELPEPSQEMLQVVVDEANRLNIVVSQFLDYARPFELARTPDHINAVAASTLALLRAQPIPESVTVIEDLAGDLPSLPLDRGRMSQVMINLLQNALQAMPEGGTLSVYTRHGENRAGSPSVEIVISDTGAGIEPADVEKLFIPFFTTKSGGTGLGLPICQRIVSAHGGELEVQSEPGKGATFTIRLPYPHTADDRTEEA